ncbi:MAG: heavy metal translocating P-type ATPase [Planctomycetota bacterium]
MSAISSSPTLEAQARATTACTHCGLPVPSGLIEDGAEHQFCCHGCKSVFAIIQGGGLTDYYAMRRQLERTKEAVPAGAQRYDAFTDPGFVERYTQTEPDGLVSASLVLEGLHCAACVWLIERLGTIVPGVIDATVAFGRARVDLRWDPEKTTLAEVARGLHALGYPVSPPRAGAADDARRIDARRQLVRIGVAGALTGNIMLVSIALYAGGFDGIADEHFTLFRWVATVLGITSLVWPGRIFFQGAVNAVRTRTTHLDIPIAIALAVGSTWGLINTVRGTGEIYFDSIASLVFLLLIGRFIQSSQQRRAHESVDLLLSVAPSTVRTADEDGTLTEKPVEAANLCETAIVYAGETLPIDGTVLKGESAVDRSILTGESAPVSIAPGDKVHAGSVNLAGELRVRIDALGDSTRAARIMKLVSDAMASKPPIVQLADRIAGYFILVVTSLAMITALAWWRVDPALAIDHATALLIVTCPCALGMATPLVLSATIGRLARAGVLVKGGKQLERLAKPGTFIVDKTGTLTTGEPVVGEWVGPEDLRPLVRALELGSNHPVGKAIARSGDAALIAPVDVQHSLGKGVRGTFGKREIAVGSPRYMNTLSVRTDSDIAAWADAVAADGATPVLIADGGAVVGGAALVDAVREDAAELVDRLSADGWSVELLSGDDERVTARTAAALGIHEDHAFGRITPEGKLAHVRTATQERAPAVMVGDGVNDAAALAAADVGIAAEGGADASLDAADVSIHKGGLGSVGLTIDAAQRAMARIRLCVCISLGYNGVAAGLAIAGLLHPLVAAVLMPISSVTVISLAASVNRRLTDGVVREEGAKA